MCSPRLCTVSVIVGFQCDCPYADCKCEFCYLVEKRRQLNSQLHDLECIDSESTKRADDDETTPPPSSNSDTDRMIRVKGGKEMLLINYMSFLVGPLRSSASL